MPGRERAALAAGAERPGERIEPAYRDLRSFGGGPGSGSAGTESSFNWR